MYWIGSCPAARCEHGAAGGDAAQPPRQAADVLARADDQARPREDAALRAEDALDRKLGAALVGRVVGGIGVRSRIDDRVTLSLSAPSCTSA